MKSSYILKLSPHRIAIGDVVKVSGRYLVTRLNVPAEFRGQGHGSSLLKLVLADADIEEVTLELWPQASGGLNHRALVNWYQRYGFQDFSGVLIRASGAPYQPWIPVGPRSDLIPKP